MRDNLVKNFDYKMIPKLIEHLAEGYSFRSFSGRYSIPLQKWEKWAREIPELIELRMAYNDMMRKKKKFYAQGYKTDLDLLLKKF
jgi:hypothetical protein